MAAVVPLSRQPPLTRAFAWSVGLHALAVLVVALPVVREAVAGWQASGRPPAPAAGPVVMEREVVVPEVTVVRVAPPAAERGFIRTDGLAEARPEAGRPRFISDRDTRGASPLPADPSATDAQPTQEGVDIPVVEVIRQELSEGEDEGLPPVAGAEAAAVAPASAAMAAAETAAAAAAEAEAAEAAAAASADDPKAVAKTVAAEAAAAADGQADGQADGEAEAETGADPLPEPAAERMALMAQSEQVVRVEKADGGAAARRRAAAALREPEVAVRPPEPAARPGAGAVPPAGFAGLRAPTRLRGTISNQGPASVDAEDTPTGRYMKQVTGAVEREWHRKRRLNRDFVTFGTIKLEFFVNARGEVQDLSIKDRTGANAVMQDFTLNAVLDAKIPPMPAGLTEILDREVLLISYDIIVY